MEPRLPIGDVFGARRGARPRRRRFGLVKLLIVLVVVLFCVDVAPTPWALDIGGRFSPLQTWQGYGPLRASNGGRYLLYTSFRGGILGGGQDEPSCSYRGCDTLFGSAKICTESGRAYSFGLTGAVHSWWSTDGAATSVDLTGPALPDGWVVALHGVWRGPALALSSPDNSFTEVFTPAGSIRTVTSTADAGTAQVTLRYGTAGGFAAACRALAAGG